MTSTPAYGFRIKPGEQAGPMQQAISAGDITEARNLLAQRFPYLKFEDLNETEQVEKPAEAAATTSASMPGATAEDTTENIYSDYLLNLPGGIRDLVTTDYKGVRGSRLGKGGYTTGSVIPGANVNLPEIKPTTPSTPSTAAPYTTYNYTYNFPAVPQQPTEAEPAAAEPTAPAATEQAPTATTGGMTPAWSRTETRLPETIRQTAGGMVASTADYGAYVAPSSAQAPATAQKAAQAIQQAVSGGTSQFGIKAALEASGEKNQLGANAAAALVASGGHAAAKETLERAEKGNIELTNNARAALERAAEKRK